MRLAFLIPTIDRIGGAERQVILLATGMAQRGWDVTVIALSGNGGDVLEQLSSRGVSFLSLEMRKGLADPRGWIRLHRWLALHKPDVVHAHLPHASLLARWSRLATPIRVLIDTIHSPATGSAVRRFAFRISCRLPDTVTAVSTATAEAWLKAGIVHDAKFSVIPNGVDIDYWKPNYEAQRSTEFGEKFVWLTVGRLHRVKDHATLLRAFALLDAHSHLLIAGTGPLEPALQRLSHELDLDDRVSFLGFQSDIRNWMHQSDAFVLSSRWEGMPVALMEACSFGLPAVITNTAGAVEVLPHPAVNPVPIGNSDLLAGAMRALMSMPKAKRRDLASDQQQAALSFDLSGVLDRYEALYRTSLDVLTSPIQLKSRADCL